MSLRQCSRCSGLEGGEVPIQECTDPRGHYLKKLSKNALAVALGSFGGRPKIYTEEERAARRQASFKRQNAKRRAAKSII